MKMFKKAGLALTAMAVSISAQANTVTWDPATGTWWEALATHVADGFSEHQIAIVGIGAFLLLAVVFRNSLMSVISMLGQLGRR